MKGINMRFIDTPGLLLSPGKVAHNANILAQVPSAAPVLSQPHASTSSHPISYWASGAASLTAGLRM